MEPKAAAVWGVGLILAAGAFSFWPNISHLRSCEDALQSELKAPSTYQRITPTWFDALTTKAYSIEYDAANSFGVPIRGHFSCPL